MPAPAAIRPNARRETPVTGSKYPPRYRSHLRDAANAGPAGFSPAQAGITSEMARGYHPQRTPFYGVCLLSGAFSACRLASSIHILWLSIVAYVLAVIAGVCGS
jgi:hypothetical protein